MYPVAKICFKHFCTLPATSVRLIAVCLTLFYCSINSNANVYEGCKYAKPIETALKSFNSPCTAEFDSCKEKQMKENNEGATRTSESCEKPLGLDPRYKGPCPSVLESLEAIENPDKDLIIAKAWLRTFFYRVDENGHVITYRIEDSKEQMRELLALDEDNYAINRFFRSYLSDVKTVAPLEIEIKLYELDPTCRRLWFFHISAISRLVVQLLERYASDSLSEKLTSDAEVTDLIARAWDTLGSLYDTAYDSSENVSKVSYALQATRHPFLTKNAQVTALVEKFLGIDSNEYQSQRFAYFANDLATKYSENGVYGRQQSLGMICNDYSFEFGLSDHCLKLILYFGQNDVALGVDLQKDVANAAIILLSAASRICDEYFGLSNPPWDMIVESKICLKKQLDSYVRLMSKWLDSYSMGEPNAYHKVLKAYIYLDELSVDYFRQALTLDMNMYKHGFWLSKRLLERGYVESAIVAMELGVESLDLARSLDLNNADELDRHFNFLETVLSTLRQQKRFYLFDEVRYSISFEN